MKLKNKINLFILILIINFPTNSKAEFKLINHQKFTLLQSLFRSQGIVSNEKGQTFFSANYTIIKTESDNLKHAVEASYLPLNKELKQFNSNHIGDIDLLEDKIIAPIEDGKKYLNPLLGIYDSNKLNFLGYVKLDPSLLNDGVPWVCTDQEQKTIITSKYSDVTEFLVYDFQSIDLNKHQINLIKKIQLPMKLNKIQGVKLLKNNFYITSNEKVEGRFLVYQYNLDTNKINSIIKLPNEVTEIEGLDIKEETENNKININVLAIINSGLKRRANLYYYSDNLH